MTENPENQEPEEPVKRGDDPLRDVRAALRERRIELGLSQQEIATRMGLKSRTNVAELEKGTHDVGTQRLARWIAAVETGLHVHIVGGQVLVTRLESPQV